MNSTHQAVLYKQIPSLFTSTARSMALRLKAVCHSMVFSDNTSIHISGNSPSIEYTFSSKMSKCQNHSQTCHQDLLQLAKARKSYPPMPSPVHYSAFTQSHCFQNYINTKFLTTPRALSPHSQKPEAVRESIDERYTQNLTNNLTNDKAVKSFDWIIKRIFPDSTLPVPYDDKLIHQSIYWDSSKAVYNVPLSPKSLKEGAFTCWLQDMSNIVSSIHGVVTSPCSLIWAPLPHPSKTNHPVIRLT